MATAYDTLLNFSVNNHVSGSAYLSSTTLTDVSPTPQYSFAANQLIVGSTIKVFAAGTFSNTSTPTLLLGLYYGGVAGTALAAIGATTTITGATSWRWQIEWRGTVRSVGSAGSIMGTGEIKLPASASVFQAGYVLPATAQAAVTIDTTTAKSLTVGAQWGTSSASNTLTCNTFLIEQSAPT